MDPIRWLHLSDLHLGCRGTALWSQVQEEFEHSIREHVAEIGMPDLILFTGDLTFKGSEDEFKQVDDFLGTLQGWLMEATGSDRQPLVFPVPGNHDLVRPEADELYSLYFLKDYAEGSNNPVIAQFQEQLWKREKVGPLAPLFRNYQAWLERSILPQFQDSVFKLHRSYFPGDLSVVYQREDKPSLLLVGLNSAWMQYHGGELKQKLELPVEQFHAALGAQGLGRCKQAEQALLLMHHPVDWLSPKSGKAFLEAIYTPSRFSLCLHGHMHEGRSTSVSESGGAYRYWFQSPSLFGVEHYGAGNEQRAIGYAWGELNADGRVRVWPLRRTRSGGEMVFVPDQAFQGFPATLRQPATGESAEQAPRPTVVIEPWLEQTLEQTGYIDIRGIGSGAGKVRSASRYPIERLYTQLRCREPDMGGERGLEALLPRHRLLLIEGQPGAGKTTFLRFTAALLARDRLGQPGPDGGTWRERYLGMDPGRSAPIPVFLRLALVEQLLGKAELKRPDNRERLLDLMLPDATNQDRAGWRALFEAGEVLLLLDGMDEVTDEAKRGRVFAMLRDLVTHWKKTRVVLSSRPIDIRPLKEMDFVHAGIEPFAKPQVAAFIEHWVRALYDTGAQADPGSEARAYQQRLLAAITERPQLRRLAANPVMLTCLCVVHWNEGGLPDARARLYRAVLHWLRAARSVQRQELGISDSFAERAFPALALAMMEGAGSDDGSKRVLFDLEEAREALLPIAKRDFPEKCVQDHRMLLGRWLRFECTGSGIIEELRNNRLRFWHLTFQEYLAAQELAWLGDGNGGDDWWPRIRSRLDDPQWRETVELLPGCLLNDGGQRRVDRLLDRVLGLLGNDAELPAQARVAGVMGRLLEPMAGYGYSPAPEIQVRYDALLTDAMAIFEREGAAQVPIKDRIAAAEALGRGGDPRLGRGLAKLIEVPGLEGWSLGKYPVTVEEYLAFVDDGAYADPRWWQPMGWEQREKGGWETPDEWDQQLLTPNRPVVSISWFEADAYCAWLSDQWGRKVRLSDDALWRCAAWGEDGRLFPWGHEERDPERANFDRNVGGPSPVGVYPAGNGPFGHCDLGGNVWEWCSDIILEDQLPSGWKRNSEGARVLRGGSWRDPGLLLAAYRIRDPAGNRGSATGFRIAVAPASLGL